MKPRNKFKFTPSSTPTPNKNHYYVLNYLPTDIAALLFVLCIEELEVLAYMITRSLKYAEPAARETKKSSKKHSFARHKSTPLFDCDCFQCYVGFWHKWDSSPNHVLIHQAIETFEENLSNGEFKADALEKGFDGKSNKKERTSHQKNGNVFENVDVGAAEKKGQGDVALPRLIGACKGLARKVLSGFMGLLNSRFWSMSDE